MTIFYSKKNHVELINDIVVKTFLSEIDFRRELSVYQQLGQSYCMKIPEIINVDEEKYKITIEYLEGPTVLELLEILEVNFQIDQAVKILLATLTWLDAFYLVFEGNDQVMGDVNLRNFIWFDNMVFGIDFESSCTGNITFEKVDLLARYLLYDPIESNFKIKVLEKVLLNLNLQDGLESMIENKVEAIKLRRSNNPNKRHILNNH
jgi:tRNA A-37 threonylcarbamoyl transferase component Bud32